MRPELAAIGSTLSKYQHVINLNATRLSIPQRITVGHDSMREFSPESIRLMSVETQVSNAPSVANRL